MQMLNHYVVLYADYMGKKKKGTLEKQKNIQFGFKWIGAHYKCVFVFIYTQNKMVNGICQVLSDEQDSRLFN